MKTLIILGLLVHVCCSLDPVSIINTIRARRISSIIGGLDSSTSDISAWLGTLGPDGKWPDSEVDYATGCQARRANWPARDHWVRITTMAAAWNGGLQGTEPFVQQPKLRAAISRAVNYWFGRDFTNTTCLDAGGSPACPCSNPNHLLWNTNWFSNVIYVPTLVGESCLILGDTLEPSQISACARVTGRSYSYNLSSLTGANALGVYRIGMDKALLTFNTSLLTDAYQRSHSELKVMDRVRSDGIRPDGAFEQHDGIIYNGNYGKDFINSILGIEIEAVGSGNSASTDARNAFEILFEGNSWMVFRNLVTGILHWDFSVLGRLITFPVIDAQATGSINMNLSAIEELGRSWNSQPLIKFAQSLMAQTTNVNAGSLLGNRMFYTNDYMVHRGQNYVSTLKMWSTRTRNTECANSQNTKGFHLSDGVLLTYLQGDEYEDIAASWDWNILPGTTTDYGATPLTCGNTNILGTEPFVGGVSDGKIGAAAMQYTNPVTRLHWRKAWFFLDDDVQHVMVSGLSSTAMPVYSVLDQRRRTGSVIVDGAEHSTSNITSAQKLWHGGVGYIFNNSSSTISIRVGQRTGVWSQIGTSTQPPTTIDLFAGWIQHKDISPLSYTTLPGTTQDDFVIKSSQLSLRTIQNDGHISAVVDDAHNTSMAIFWDVGGGSVSFEGSQGPVTITTNGNAAIIYRMQTGDVTASDPSQSLSSIQVNITTKDGVSTLSLSLPTNGLAGNSVGGVPSMIDRQASSAIADRKGRWFKTLLPLLLCLVGCF